MILPAYNVAGYIDACLESVTQQDIPASDYEIIVVNDGSTDDTPRHIAQWAAKHRNIRVVNQENQGQSAARNNGLKQASGEYIWFIDSDDTICPNCLGGLLDACDRLQTDMFCVGPSIPFTDKFPEDFDVNIYISDVYNGGGNWIKSGQAIMVAWGYIIRRSFWINSGLNFVEGIVYEDAECMSRSFYYAKRLCGLNKFSVYNYVQRTDSIMHKLLNWSEVQSFPIIIKSLNTFANNIKDDFFIAFYRETCTGAFINGLKQFKYNKGLKQHLNEYMHQVHQAGKIYNMAQSLPKKIYRFIAIHFPRLFLKIC